MSIVENLQVQRAVNPGRDVQKRCDEDQGKDETGANAFAGKNTNKRIGEAEIR